MNRIIADAARQECELERISGELANEKNHREWAIGRIKDQQTLITGLRNALKAASKDRYNKWIENNVKNEEQ